MSFHSSLENQYNNLADEARRSADAAHLANVRDRFLRSEDAWRRLAGGAAAQAGLAAPRKYPAPVAEAGIKIVPQ